MTSSSTAQKHSTNFEKVISGLTVNERKLLDCHGGIAYDHGTLPKIVAVHSLTEDCSIIPAWSESSTSQNNSLYQRLSQQGKNFKEIIFSIKSGAPFFNTHSMYLPEQYSKEHYKHTSPPREMLHVPDRNLNIAQEFTEYQILPQNTSPCLIENCTEYSHGPPHAESEPNECEFNKMEQVTSAVSSQNEVSTNPSSSNVNEAMNVAHNCNDLLYAPLQLCSSSSSANTSPSCVDSTINVALAEKHLKSSAIPHHHDSMQSCSSNSSASHYNNYVDRTIKEADKHQKPSVTLHYLPLQLFPPSSIDYVSLDKELAQRRRTSNIEFSPHNMEKVKTEKDNEVSNCLFQKADIRTDTTDNDFPSSQSEDVRISTSTQNAIPEDGEPTTQQEVENIPSRVKPRLRFRIIRNLKDSEPTASEKSSNLTGKSGCKLSLNKQNTPNSTDKEQIAQQKVKGGIPSRKCRVLQINSKTLSEKFSDLTKLGYSVSSAINILTKRGDIKKRNTELNTPERDKNVLTEEFLLKFVNREKLRKKCQASNTSNRLTNVNKNGAPTANRTTYHSKNKVQTSLQEADANKVMTANMHVKNDLPHRYVKRLPVSSTDFDNVNDSGHCTKPMFNELSIHPNSNASRVYNRYEVSSLPNKPYRVVKLNMVGNSSHNAFDVDSYSSKFNMGNEWTIQESNTAELLVPKSEKSETLQNPLETSKRLLERKETLPGECPSKRTRKSTPRKLLKLDRQEYQAESSYKSCEMVDAAKEETSFNNSLVDNISSRQLKRFTKSSNLVTEPGHLIEDELPHKSVMHSVLTELERSTETTTIFSTRGKDSALPVAEHYPIDTSLDREQRIKTLLAKQTLLLSKISCNKNDMG